MWLAGERGDQSSKQMALAHALLGTLLWGRCCRFSFVGEPQCMFRTVCGEVTVSVCRGNHIRWIYVIGMFSRVNRPFETGS